MAQNKYWFVNILVALFVAYLLFLCYKAIVNNYKTTARISSLNEEISLVEEEKEYMEALNLYYGTNTFKELEARRKLGLKLPDEQVVKVPTAEEESDSSSFQPQVKDDNESKKPLAKEGNPRKWLRFVLRV
ncbi:hypothetical protein KBB60_00660 [Patescibacteria group bacterium]|jgi:hypothetical protein|nr:hypothetical protein [Patescibacteria group bacterium]